MSLPQTETSESINYGTAEMPAYTCVLCLTVKPHTDFPLLRKADGSYGINTGNCRKCLMVIERYLRREAGYRI